MRDEDFPCLRCGAAHVPAVLNGVRCRRCVGCGDVWESSSDEVAIPAPVVVAPPVLEPGLELPCPLCTAPVRVVKVALDTADLIVDGLVLSHHDVPAPDLPAPACWHTYAATCPMSGQAVRVRR